MNLPNYSEIQEIEISLIKEANNTRTDYNEKDIDELAESISSVGMLHPLIVYKNANHYELIAGYQRRRAAIKNNWNTVPVKVLENPSPDLIINIQIIENAQRKDIHPMDEALAFLLINASSEEIAARIGKSVRYVNDRISLNKLSDKSRQLFRENVINILHGLLLCRISANEQDKILDLFIVGESPKIAGTVKHLRTLINNHASVNLKHAKFDTSCSNLNNKSCTNCEHRYGFNKSLFNNIESEDVCYNVSCFNIKNILHCINIEQLIKEKGVIPVRLTELENSEHTDKYNLVSDYEFTVTPIKLSDIKETDIIGIYFESYKRSKIGTISVLRHKSKDYEPEQTPDALREIRVAKAFRAFMNTIMNEIGHKIGEKGSDVLPNSILLYFCELLYTNLPEEQKEEINKFNGWENSSEYDREYFRSKEVSEPRVLLLILVFYGLLKNNTLNEMHYYYISKICKEWDIDIKTTLKEIEEEFHIELHYVNSMLTG